MASIIARKRSDGTTAYTAQVRIRRNGRLYTEARTFDRRAMAVAWAREREDEIRRNPDAIGRSRHRGLTVGELIGRYIDEREAIEPLGRSKMAHLRLLQSFELAERVAQDVTPQQLVEHVRKRRLSGAGPSTVANDLIWLRVVYRYARTAMGVPVSPHVIDDAAEVCRAERIIARPKRRTRRPTDDELRRITAWFAAPKTAKVKGPPMDLIMWFAIYSCRRMSEIFDLRLSDFDREHMTWLVRDVKNPAGSAGNHREMLVPDRLLPVIDAILERVPRVPGEDRLLPFKANSIGTYWCKQMKVLGIDDLHFHDLRHEGCSRLAEDGWSIPQIQQVSLHESWSSLQVYVNMRRRKTARVEFDDALDVRQAWPRSRSSS